MGGVPAHGRSWDLRSFPTQNMPGSHWIMIPVVESTAPVLSVSNTQFNFPAMFEVNSLGLEQFLLVLCQSLMLQGHSKLFLTYGINPGKSLS